MAFLLLKQSSATYNILLALFIIHLSMSTTEATRIRLPVNGTFPALIAFGDSILDTGNNNNLLRTTTKCNFPPYGINFVGRKATGRFGDGEVLTDIIAEGLGIKATVPAYLDPDLQSKDLVTGVCFASGGAGFDPMTSLQLQVISLQAQLNYFKEYVGKVKGVVGEEKANKILSNSVFLLSAANNDLAITYFNTPIRIPHFTVDVYTSKVINWASTYIKDLYAVGVRKLAVLGALPLGCLPGLRTQRGGLLRLCTNHINEAALLLNSKLSTEIKKLNSSLPDAKIVYVDVFNPMFDLANNPDSEFKVRDRGCCGSGTIELGPLCNEFTPACSNASQYLFWDSVHPTERACRIIAPSIVKNLKKHFS